MPVVVVGSINVDVTVPVGLPPRAGETQLGGAAVRSAGGKGANQAVALSRLGRQVQMVGAVGADADGDFMIATLTREGVGVDHVHRVAEATGQAFVFVSAGGESTIVVAPGANGALTPDQVRTPEVRDADFLVLQQEVPADTVAAAIAATRGRVLLNPAPARPLAPAVLAQVDVLVPNREELAALVGGAPLHTYEQIAGAARGLAVRGSVVVTLGSDGALVVTPERTMHVPAREVVAVDATAAGDSFCAGLADALLAGADLVAAAEFATGVAAVTVTRPGAIDSLPRRSELARA